MFSIWKPRRRNHVIMVQRLFLTTLVALIGISLTACNDSNSPPAETEVSKPVVAATNFPLFCWLESICKSSGVEVVYLGPGRDLEGDSSHWSPDLSQVLRLQKADLIFRNGPGAEYATWLNRVSIDETKLKSLTDTMGLDEFVMVKDWGTVHRHGPEGEHSHPSIVSRCWLSPEMSLRQSNWCVEQLAEQYPNHKDVFKSNGLKLEALLQQLSLKTKQLAKQVKGKTIVVSNPEARYLFQLMGIETTSLNWREFPADDGQEQLEKVCGSLSKQNAIFVWTFSPTEAQRKIVSEFVGSQCVLELIDGGDPESGADQRYLALMQKNLDCIREATSN